MMFVDHDVLKAKRMIRFPDSETSQDLFVLADGAKLLFHDSHLNEDKAVRCSYIDPTHFSFGNSVFHIHQFAEVMLGNGHSYEPLNFVTDLSVYDKKYFDRDLLDAEGKRIPYVVMVGSERGHYNDVTKGIAFCPQASEERQVCVFSFSPDGGQWKRFYSADALLHEIHSNGNVALESGNGYIPLAPYEKSLLIATVNEHCRQMPHLPLREYENIPKDYRGTYQDYSGDHPDWKGRRTAFLDEHGTTLFIEGISFIIDEGRALDKLIGTAKNRTAPATPTHEQGREAER